MKKKTLLSLMFLLPSFAFAQIVISDEDLQNQLRSMETGPVCFSPKDYYMAFHDNGLGRDSYSVYHWKPPTLSHLLGSWELSESRSKAKPLVEFYRTPRIALEILNNSYAEKEWQEVNEQLEREVVDAADRQFDLVYDKYKNKFMGLQISIGGKLQYCLRKGGTLVSSHVTNLSDLNDMLCTQIEYVHKDLTNGVGHEIPSAQRIKEYERIEKQMQKLLGVVNMLVKYVVINYDKQ